MQSIAGANLSPGDYSTGASCEMPGMRQYLYAIFNYSEIRIQGSAYCLKKPQITSVALMAVEGVSLLPELFKPPGQA